MKIALIQETKEQIINRINRQASIERRALARMNPKCLRCKKRSGLFYYCPYCNDVKLLKKGGA